MSDTTKFSITAQDALTALAGLCPGGLGGNACRGFANSLGAAIDQTAKLHFEVPTPQDLLDLIAGWKEKADALQLQVEELLGNAPTPGGPASLPGGDPLLPLRRLAEAINEAEKQLNGQNLLIAGGTIDVQLTVAVGGASAGANIRLDIQAKPVA